MNRVYRLLRNNKELGPFTIGELLGQSPRPSDMLWIEGESTAWCYLSEIELTLPHPEAPSPAPRLQFSQKAELEQRAEALRKEVMHHKPPPVLVKEEKDANGERHYFIPTADESTIDFVDHRKQKSTAVSDVFMTALIVAIFAGGLYGGRSLFSPQQQRSASVVVADQHEAKASVAQPSEGLTAPVDTTTVADTMLKTAAKPVFRSSQSQTPDSVKENGAAPVDQETAVDHTADVNTTVQDVPALQPEPIHKKEEAGVKQEKPKAEKEDTVKADEPEKKKGFLRKLFGKKKKDEDKEKD